MKILDKLLYFINFVCSICLALSYLSHYFEPGKYWQFGIFGLLFPFFCIANLVFILFWIIRKKLFFLCSFLTILIGWNSFKGIFGFKLPVENVSSKPDFSLITYNIRALSQLKKYPTLDFTENRKYFSNYFEEVGISDIWCLQETTKPNVNFLTEQFNLTFSVRYPGYDSHTAILSKYPILKSGNIDLKKGHGDCVWADIIVKGRVIRFYSVHLHSNSISIQADSLFNAKHIEKKTAVDGAINMFEKYKKAAEIRFFQAKIIKNHMKQSNFPIVITGDFNDTPQSYIYQYLQDGLSDSFKERGIGLGTTWVGNPPGLKIDYILKNDTLTTLKHNILRKKFSDHYPIQVEFEIK